MKSILRKEIKSRRRDLSISEVKEKSSIIINKLFLSELFEKSDMIMSYMNFDNEVETADLNKQTLLKKEKLVIPYIDRESDLVYPVMIRELSDFVKGKYDILEPRDKSCIVKLEEIDMVIIPGIAFDNKGNRIGFGKGYYDKFLANFVGVKVALAYDFQIVEEIESDEHDIKMDIIYSESNIFRRGY